MASNPPEKYIVELMPVNENDRTRCGQACPSCVFAKRGENSQNLAVTKAQQDVLMELTGAMPEGGLEGIYLYYNLFSPASVPLAEKIVLAQVPKNVTIASGHIDPSLKFSQNLASRVQALVPFRLDAEVKDSSILNLDFCFENLNSEMLWGQEHVDFARGVLQDLRLSLWNVLSSTTYNSNDLLYSPHAFCLSESWNWMPAGVQNFGAQEFMQHLYRDRRKVASELAPDAFGLTQQAFLNQSKAKAISSSVGGFSFNSCGEWSADCFTMDSSFLYQRDWFRFGSRLLNLSQKTGFQSVDYSKLSFAILGDQVWVYHNTSYATDGSLRFKFPEFQAILKRVQNQEGTLRELVDGEIRKRRGVSQ